MPTDRPTPSARSRELVTELERSLDPVEVLRERVRAVPDDRLAWAELAVLHAERGDLTRAVACRERAAPQPGAVPATDADVARLAHRLAGREGVHARMWADPKRGAGYSPVAAPLTPGILRAHLDGRITAGTYLVRLDGTTGLLVLDIDVTRAATRIAGEDAAKRASLLDAAGRAGIALRDHLRAAGLDPVLVDSGSKGRHLWCFLPDGTPAQEARRIGMALVKAHPLASDDLAVEVFPKQDRVEEGGLGNLVKLPLGIHLRTGRRAWVLDEAGEPAPHGIRALLEARAVDVHTIRVPAAPAAPPEPGPPPGWTEDRFRAPGPVAAVLAGCPALSALVDQTLSRRALAHDESIVLAHSLGHLPEGARAVHYLQSICPGFPADQRMGAPHRGNPVSCARIRSRIPEVTRRVDCTCRFPDEPGRYATPVRYADGVAQAASTTTPLDDAARIGRLRAEAAAAEAAFVERLAALPGRSLLTEEGVWRLVDDAGRLVARLTPAR